MEQNLAILTSVLAFVFSVVAFFISMRAQKLMALNAELIQKSMFHMDSSTEYEGRLVDWPEAFALYGIDLERAGQEGVSAQNITYMVLVVTALVSRCRANGISIYDRLRESVYHRHLFASELTRKTWSYSQCFHCSGAIRDINRYLREEYGGGDDRTSVHSCDSNALV